MEFLVTLLIIIATIVAIILITAMFTRKEYTIQREIIIDRIRQEVFNYLKYLRNQDHFSKWALMDPKMKKEYRGTDGTVGFVSAWESANKRVGKGEQEIKKIKDGEKIDMAIYFIKPFRERAYSYFMTDSISGDRTKVKWVFRSRMNFPMNIMLLFMNIEKQIGDDLEEGLKNLKKVLEKREAVNEPQQMEQVSNI